MYTNYTTSLVGQSYLVMHMLVKYDSHSNLATKWAEPALLHWRSDTFHTVVSCCHGCCKVRLILTPGATLLSEEWDS